MTRPIVASNENPITVSIVCYEDTTIDLWTKRWKIKINESELRYVHPKERILPHSRNEQRPNHK